MEINSSAGYASAATALQGRSDFQVGQLKQGADQQQQAAQMLQTGGNGQSSGGNPTASRGSIVNILA